VPSVKRSATGTELRAVGAPRSGDLPTASHPRRRGHEHGAARAFPAALDAARSARMGAIRQSGTEPELVVRRLLRTLKVRTQANARGLPGTPDMANRRRRLAIFVHGCFWHRHAGCSKATTPRHNRSHWVRKFAENVRRDARHVAELEQMGFRVIVVWECETREPERLVRRLRRKLRFVVSKPG
jgi:DNA mismatch endonuclease, patch repair protein